MVKHRAQEHRAGGGDTRIRRDWVARGEMRWQGVAKKEGSESKGRHGNVWDRRDQPDFGILPAPSMLVAAIISDDDNERAAPVLKGVGNIVHSSAHQQHPL